MDMDPPQYKYVGFVGCYTKEGQADPFEGSHGGVPHDRSKVGRGVLSIGVGTSGKLFLLNDGEPIIKAEDLVNPSYLCILKSTDSASSHRPAALRNGGLCIVSEVANGKFQSFAVHRDKTKSGMMFNAKPVGKALDTGGSYPCHIINSEVGSHMESICVCNYGEDGGVLSIFSSSVDAYTKQVCIPFGPGSKADPDRQQNSHAHSASVVTPFSPTSLVDLCCADLGSDAIVQYSMSTNKSGSAGHISLQCVETERLVSPSGSGPRSIMFNPVFSNIAIVSLEMTAQIWLIRRRMDNGSFESVCDPVSVIPNNWPSESAKENQFNRGRWASDAIWRPDGKFVYAAARLHNSISVFQLQPCQLSATEGPTSETRELDGLKLVQRFSTGGLTPRCLCMTECGKFILVAHQHSHDVSSYSIDVLDGTLSFTDRLEVPNAACVKLSRPEQIG